ncbi:MAG: hypothetical protein WAO98_07750, partial [Alphaproteobacteria bacterium]
MNKVYRPFLSLAVLFVVAVLSLPAAAQPSLASATQQPPKPLFSSPITSIQNLITGPAQSTPVPSGSAAPSILQ